MVMIIMGGESLLSVLGIHLTILFGSEWRARFVAALPTWVLYIRV